MVELVSEIESISEKSDSHLLSPRSPDLHKYGDPKKIEEMQVQLMTKVGQFEKEAKERRAAEQRCKETQNKYDQLQLVMQSRSEEFDEEKRQRVAAEERCRTLELTIDKLEEYLRKKNTSDYQHVGKRDADGSSLSEVIDRERKQEEVYNELLRYKKTNDRLQQRCEDLERKLQENDIQFENLTLKNNDIDDELDF